jgi:NAD(P)H-dependent FMN reductase
MKLPMTDAGEALKAPQFSATVDRADALIIAAPEYNHGYPGLLKHALDSNLKEYIPSTKMICPECGMEMNHHADKLGLSGAAAEPEATDSDLGGVIEEAHTCPSCGKGAARRAASG